MTPVSRRIVLAILAAAMAVFAALQINDPDPLRWVLLYGATTALLVAAFFGWSRRWAIVIVWSVYAVWGALLVPGFLEWLFRHPWSDLVGVMSVERQYIEDSRELLGLLIAAICLLFPWLVPPAERER